MSTTTFPSLFPYHYFQVKSPLTSASLWSSVLISNPSMYGCRTSSVNTSLCILNRKEIRVKTPLHNSVSNSKRTNYIISWITQGILFGSHVRSIGERAHTQRHHQPHSAFFYHIKQINSMLSWVCSVIDNKRRKNVVRTSVTHSLLPRSTLELCLYTSTQNADTPLTLVKGSKLAKMLLRTLKRTISSWNPVHKCASVINCG